MVEVGWWCGDRMVGRWWQNGDGRMVVWWWEGEMVVDGGMVGW